MSNKITTWPPVLEEWITQSGNPLFRYNYEIYFNQIGPAYRLMRSTNKEYSSVYIFNEKNNWAIDQIEADTLEAAVIKGFNHLIELGIIKLNIPADCNGPVEDSIHSFTDSLSKYDIKLLLIDDIMKRKIFNNIPRSLHRYLN